MTKPYFSRLPCEINEAFPFAVITDFNPDTGEPFGLRIKQLSRYDEEQEASHDEAARLHSRAMQGRDA